MLTRNTIEIIQSTVPLLEMHGEAITNIFYEQLFRNHPSLKNIFNMANQGKGNQSRALSGAVLAYAKNIDQIETLLPVVNRIAHKHVSLGVQAKQYAVVGETLLSAIQAVLNLPDNHAALSAWAEAYNFLAQVFIDVESGIYQANSDKSNGWEGDRDFLITAIDAETPDVKSFYLTPKDQAGIPSFSAGQYLGVKVKPDNSEYEAIRQYSLSQQLSKAEAFRISVKREDNGVVSQHLHQANVGDLVRLQAPTGVFTLQAKKPKYIFVAGGIGITPLFCMLQEALLTGVAGKDILFVQSTKDTQSLIFHDALLALQEKYGIHYKTCLSQSKQGDHEGRLNQATLVEWTNEGGLTVENTQAYLCGSVPFMSAINTYIKAMNYAETQIHYEVFGPTTKL